MAFQFLRNEFFWLFDKLNGSRIKNHYQNISNLNTSKNVKKRNEQINDLLQHVASTTKYYRNNRVFKGLSDFPVVNKTIIKDNFEAFKSTEYVDKSNYKVSTSGSTGVPFFLYQDVNKRLRNTADNLYFWEQANFSIGQKIYFLEAWRNVNMNNPIKSWMKNLVYVDISSFGEVEIESFLQKMKNDSSEINIMGLPSAFEAICKYLDKSKNVDFDEIKVNSIVAVSECLSPYVKESMKKYFKAEVVSRYSNEELGILAQQLPNGSNDFHINWASYYVELLNLENDEPVEQGKLGRIVITDLYNYCMPIIRYDTGDLAVFNKKNSDFTGYPTFQKIEGRKMDVVYTTNGELISPHLIYTLFYEYYSVLNQYQFIQTGEKTFTVKLNAPNNEFKDSEKLISNIKANFGLDAEVSIEMVDDIPTLASGKRKKVVNLFHKN